MFDTYYQGRSTTEYVTKEVNITEKKAPTDESIKLLNEMTDKAIKNIVQKVSTSNNTLQMFCMTFRDWRTDELCFTCKMTLNNKEHIFDIKVLDFDCINQVQLVDKIYNAVCKKLTNEIMKPLLDEIMKPFGVRE